MPKGKVTFIVEGDLELNFLKHQCGNSSIVRKVPSNGDDVSMECLAKMVKAIVQIGNEPSSLFVVLDREHRKSSSEELEKDLSKRLQAMGLAGSLHVHFADRMIENWILADQSVLDTNQLEVKLGVGGAEGIGGKSKLKEAYKKKGLSYNERLDGSKLLSQCSAKTLAEKSYSFKRLSESLTAEKIPCNWAKK